MTTIKEEFEFPCGMKVKLEARGLWSFTFDLADCVCPLHGKNCPPKKK